MEIVSTPVETLLRKGNALRRQLLERNNLLDVRIAVLGGSTTSEVTSFLELLLLDQGFRPVFYHSEYNRYFEDAVVDSSQLIEFRPNLILVYTSCVNLHGIPALDASESDFGRCVSLEVARFATIWNSIHEKTGCLIIQNNFELPTHRLLGNLDCVSPGGHTRFISCLNYEFARAAGTRSRLLINDLNSIAAWVGLERFHDRRRWFTSKLVTTPEGSLAIAKSLAALIGGVYGRSRKCLVLDLDNTLWGGVIGDDGPDQIIIGKETARAEAFTAFQQYCLYLRNRGVILAVCSKNDEQIARKGFEHPDSVLRINHFACLKINWEPKHENIQAIAAELNIGLESLVFVDDNPAERAIVSAQLPTVAVPDIGNDVSGFINVLEQKRYFEPVALSQEDLNRANQYQSNTQRSLHLAQFSSYDEYLDSLDMIAEIAPFRSIYLNRITQLINKTNQFNLTTRRYTLAEIERIAADSGYITLYCKLTDKFGDNGLISCIIGRREAQSLHIDLWLMSCRVLKRGVEQAMLDSLVTTCRGKGIIEIHGYYIATERNAMVYDHYQKLGFEPVNGNGLSPSVWKLLLTPAYVSRNKHIKELVLE